jgi:hypothetical protein
VRSFNVPSKRILYVAATIAIAWGVFSGIAYFSQDSWGIELTIGRALLPVLVGLAILVATRFQPISEKRTVPGGAGKKLIIAAITLAFLVASFAFGIMIGAEP